MGFVTPEKERDVFLEWQKQRRRTIRAFLLSPLLVLIVVVLMFFGTSQGQVPVAHGPEVLVLVTRVQEIQQEMLEIPEEMPETLVQEIPVPKTQLKEIQPGMLEIRVPVTQWLEIQVPETRVPVTHVLEIQPETQWLEIQVELTKWLERQVPKMERLEIFVPVAQVQEKIQPETQWLAILVSVAQLQEMQPEEQELVAEVPEPEIPFYLIVWICIVYSTVPIVIQQCVIKPKQRRLSRKACIFVALAAAEDLEKSDPVRAALSMDKLLLALSDLLGQKSIALGMSAVPPGEYMHITPGKIPKRAVFQAIQASEDTNDFQERLRHLASGLRSKVDTGYLATHKFLAWLDWKTKDYQEASKSFFEKRPTLRTIIVYLGPPTVAALGGIAILVVEILRQ